MRFLALQPAIKGVGSTSSTVCDWGLGYVNIDIYHSQCRPGALTSTLAPTITKASNTVQPTTASTTSSAPQSSVCSGRRTKFKYFGVNESGADFGDGKIPGVLGTDYARLSPSSIDVSTRDSTELGHH